MRNIPALCQKKGLMDHYFSLAVKQDYNWALANSLKVWKNCIKSGGR